MEASILDGKLIYTLSHAEALTVTHTGTYEYCHAHPRSMYAFVYVPDGCIEFKFIDPAETIPVSKGQVIYIPKGVRYVATYRPEQTRAVLFQFDLDGSTEQLPPDRPVRMPSGSRRVYRDTGNPHAFISGLRCAAGIYELLAILHQEDPTLPKKHKRLLPAIEELQRDPTQNEPISYYAALCHMSVPGFRRSFKEYMGQSPVEFRNELRLLNARKLILQREYSVEAAARISGFSNLSFFYRLFRRKFGTKPGHL